MNITCESVTNVFRCPLLFATDDYVSLAILLIVPTHMREPVLELKPRYRFRKVFIFCVALLRFVFHLNSSLHPREVAAVYFLWICTASAAVKRDKACVLRWVRGGVSSRSVQDVDEPCFLNCAKPHADIIDFVVFERW